LPSRDAESYDGIRPISVKRETLGSFIAKVIYFFRRNVRFVLAWRLDLVMTLLGVGTTTVMWGLLATMVGGGAQSYLNRYGYGGNYFSFLIIGLIANDYLWIPMQRLYSYLQSHWGTGWLDFMLITPSNPLSVLLGPQAYSFVLVSVQATIQVLVGYFVFQLRFDPNANLFALVIIIPMSMIAAIGWGLMSASTFTLINAKGGSNPVLWFLTTFTPLLSGVYYTPEILPNWVEPLGLILPHTYVIKGLRKALLSGASLADLTPEITGLAALSLIILPLGYMIFRWSIDKGRRDGTIMPW